MSLLLSIKFSSLRFMLVMFDSLGDDFPFDWLDWVKNSLQTLYVYLANSYLKCHETKIEIKRSLHELLGWFFAQCTLLFPTLVQNSKINCLMVLWRCQRLHEIDIIFISLQKIFNFLNSIAEILIIALTIGKTMCIWEIYFPQIGFYLAHFHEKIQWKSKKFSGSLPQTSTGLCPGSASALTVPSLPKPPADYSDRCAIVFSKS